MPVRANVVEVVRVQERAIVACDLIEGDIAPRSVLKVEGSGDIWDVVGIKLPTPELYAVGRRGLMLRPARNDQTLAVGDVLIDQ